MHWRPPRPHRRARIVSGLVLASTLTLGQVLPAFAQEAGPASSAGQAPSGSGARPPAAFTPRSPIGPGQGPVRGVTLEQALEAVQAATPNRPAKPVSEAAVADVTGGAISAVFIPAAGTLVVICNDLDNTIVVGRDAAGKLLVNGGAVAVLGGTATVANTTVIEIFGLGGNDNLSLNESVGALPGALMFGGAGNDTLTGGSSLDQLFGQAGNDTLLGKGGNDFLFGGADNDVLTGGDGDDQVFGEAGDDRFIWNPGDDSDLNEGGDGTDTVEVNGGNGAEQFTATANGTRVRFDRTAPAPFFLDIGTSEKLVVNMNGGDDTFTGGNGLAPLIQLTVDGGAGNDTITGGDGNDVLLGGDGNDTIIGGRGNDLASMGAGDDTFVWNPGDGSDTVEGQDGADTMLFNGANIAEKFDVSANGQRVRFTRDVANIVMDFDGIERLDVKELGGTDQTTVNDLSGTALTAVDLNLAAAGGSGDGAVDAVIVNATARDDAVVIAAGDAGSAQVLGLAARVTLAGTDANLDTLKVAALAGDDTIEASSLPAGIVGLTEDGGDGNDVLIGSAGNDVLIGGNGDDVLIGGIGGDGQDVLNGAPGNDILIQ
jgi:Ca2+-binding RTX toxin-like protein